DDTPSLPSPAARTLAFPEPPPDSQGSQASYIPRRGGSGGSYFLLARTAYADRASTVPFAIAWRHFPAGAIRMRDVCRTSSASNAGVSPDFLRVRGPGPTPLALAPEVPASLPEHEGSPPPSAIVSGDAASLNRKSFNPFPAVCPASCVPSNSRKMYVPASSKASSIT
ncbi:MAG: hypothetical protein BJ554DRAFT_2268, partial [Olpidium bornovanus]